LTLHADDDNGDLVTWRVGSAADHGTATVGGAGASQVVGYTPATNYNGPDSFVVQATDSHSATAALAVSLTILPVNDAPYFDSAPVLTATVGAPYTYTVVAGDVDVATHAGDVLTLTAPVLPDWMAFAQVAQSSSLLTGLPTEDDVGTHTVTLRVHDSASASDVQNFIITVVDNDRTWTIYLPTLWIFQNGSLNCDTQEIFAD
jgi:hypothetical protein